MKKRRLTRQIRNSPRNLQSPIIGRRMTSRRSYKKSIKRRSYKKSIKRRSYKKSIKRMVLKKDGTKDDENVTKISKKFLYEISLKSNLNIYDRFCRTLTDKKYHLFNIINPHIK